MASKKQPKPRAKKATDSPQAAIPTPFPTTDTMEGIERKDGHVATDGSTPQVSPTPFPTATIEGRKDAGSLDTADGSTTSSTQQPSPAAFPTATREGMEGSNTTDGSTAGITQLTPSAGKNETGDVAACSAVAESPVAFGLLDVPLLAHAKSGESRHTCWERLRKEARAAGLPKGQGPGTAYEWATREVELLFPPREPEPAMEADPESIEEPEAVAVEIPEPIELDEPPPAPIPSDQGVPGLGTIPESWGSLPANASLQSEIAWVSANRLRVRDGSGVDLSKSLSPAPSYSALSWLETSILFPSKFADISVKATQNQEDEAQHVRREKLAIDEIRALLAEMMEE